MEWYHSHIMITIYMLTNLGNRLFWALGGISVARKDEKGRLLTISKWQHPINIENENTPADKSFYFCIRQQTRFAFVSRFRPLEMISSLPIIMQFNGQTVEILVGTNSQYFTAQQSTENSNSSRFSNICRYKKKGTKKQKKNYKHICI